MHSTFAIPTHDHHRYQREVAALLDQIRHRVEELRRLHVHGVRRAALADRKRELARARQQLAELVGGRERPSTAGRVNAATPARP